MDSIIKIFWKKVKMIFIGFFEFFWLFDFEFNLIMGRNYIVLLNFVFGIFLEILR